MRPRLNYVPEVLRAQAILRVSAAAHAGGAGAGAGAGAMSLLSGRQSALDARHRQLSCARRDTAGTV
jgi:hypothetical protein